MAKELSTNEKATEVNRLLCLKWSGTQKENKDCPIGRAFESYNKETNMLIDSYMWNLYGLHYKDYLETTIGLAHLCTYDVVKLDKALDRKLAYLREQVREELGQNAV